MSSYALPYAGLYLFLRGGSEDWGAGRLHWVSLPHIVPGFLRQCDRRTKD